METLPKEWAKRDNAAARIAYVYDVLWKNKYGTTYYADFGSLGRMVKKLLENYSEWQIAALCIVHFNWHGMDGTDVEKQRWLENAGHPILWMPKNIPQYATFLTNVERAPFDQHEEVKAYVLDVMDKMQKS